MNSIIENFQKIMRKYKFLDETPADIRDFSLASSRKGLTNILKISGDYSFIFGRMLFIYYTAKKLGIKASFLQIKITLAIISIFITLSAIIGIYLFVKPFNNSSPVTIIDKKKKKPEKYFPAQTRFKIGIEAFEGSTNEAGRRVTTAVSNSLTKILGPGSVTLVSKKNRSPVPKVLTGSIRQLGKNRYISIKIIDVESSKVEFAAAEKVTSENTVSSACFKLSKKIADRIK
ncbi:MAG: hypothetical protein GY754_23270 [bacterium]|nr:hypothetical protein [bacterium]